MVPPIYKIAGKYLGEDLVLVHGDESAQVEGGHAVYHDGVCRPVRSIIFFYQLSWVKTGK